MTTRGSRRRARPEGPAPARRDAQAPSTVVRRSRRRRAARYPAPTPPAARGSTRSVRARESSVSRGLVQALHGHALVRRLDGGLGLRRHVVLIVLSKHFGGVKHAIRPQRSLRDNTLAFLEQV